MRKHDKNEEDDNNGHGGNFASSNVPFTEDEKFSINSNQTNTPSFHTHYAWLQHTVG